MKTKTLFKKLAFNIAILLAIFGLLEISPLIKHAQAASTDITINEIMYNPLSDNSNDEFLELYNNSPDPTDISGWCFTAGISYCFPASTTMAGHSYLVLSPDAAQSLTTYSITVNHVYTGKLSNSGEKIDLKDNSSNLIDTVSYSDSSPWPVSPDGTGPSLELKGPNLDNDLAASWGASLASNGTPGATNSLTTADLPLLSNLSTPKNTSSLETIQPTDTPTITIHASNVTSVNLVYKVMFAADVTIAMNDNGTGADLAVGDNIYSASIPAQTAGSLVRYKVAASNASTSTSFPGADDTMTYKGYIVNDGQTATIPIVRWYMDDDDYTDMTTNHLTDDQQFQAVVAVGNDLFDSAKVRVKGQSSVNFPKRKYKFDLPSGYTVRPEGFDYGVDEFSINVYFSNQTDLQEGMGWKAINYFGFHKLQNRYVRVLRNTTSGNSEFVGHYLLIETYDGKWRQENGYDSGAMYKQGNDKKTRLDEDDSDIQTLKTNLTNLQGQALKDYLLDNLNIPALVNYHALSAAMFHDDWFFGKNLYQYRDTDGTGRWEYLPWDIDNAFTTPLFDGIDQSDYFKYPILGELKKAITGADIFYDDAIIEKAMYQFPEFREMFFRRSMNIYDQLWGNDKYLEWFNQFYSPSEQTMADDLTLWNPSKKILYQSIFPNGLPFSVPADFPFDLDPVHFFDFLDDQTPALNRELYIYGANRMKSMVRTARDKEELLGVQTSNEESKIQITEINYNPAGQDDTEFVELYNNSDKSVDISNWQLEGVDFTFPAGSVLPGKTYGLIVKNDTTFRASYSSQLILGQYTGDLTNGGEQLRLLNSTNQVISSVEYGINNPWPSSPNGGGFTLGLIHVNANEVLAACWAPSSSLGGTPGTVNDYDQAWVQAHSSGCEDRDYQLPGSSGASDLAQTGSNAKFISEISIILMILSLAFFYNSAYGKIRLNIRR